MSALAFDLPKQYRLRDSLAFKRVLATGNKIINQCLVVFYQENKLLHPRLGIIVQKQNIKAAVKRNELKRIVRESFRQARTSLSHANLDIIISFRSDYNLLTERDKKTLRISIDRLWPRIAQA